MIADTMLRGCCPDCGPHEQFQDVAICPKGCAAYYCERCGAISCQNAPHGATLVYLTSFHLYACP